MVKSLRFAGVVAATLLVVLLSFAQGHEPVDLDAVFKIKDEGMNRSEAMKTMSYLTDVHGPRLTNSPGMHNSATWTEGQLKEWGMENVHREAWGPFGMGWSNERFVAHVTSPQRYPVIGAAYAWTPGTKKAVKGEVIHAPMQNEEDMEKFIGKLKGKIVLTSAMRDVDPAFEAPARRWTDEQLDGLTDQPFPRARRGGGPDRRALRQRFRQFRSKLQKFYQEEGVLAVATMSSWNYGIMRVGGAGSRQPDEPRGPVQFMLSAEHYGRIVRTLEKDIPVTMEIDIRNTFHKENMDSYNIFAEIPGTDKADEVVMLGGHFDSWHTGTGATDNGAGSTVMMEALRILKATGLPMRRTVRLGLWTGEEQGLLGSRAYVKEHFAEANDGEWDVKSEHEKLSVYFNIDNGGGKIRGINLQGHEAAAPVVRTWLRLFENMGVNPDAMAIRNTGGTDHLAFNAVGLPGFQFIQDPMDYSTRTHHSNMDTYERIVENDMKQIAIIVATMVYHAANREEMFPRKPMPEVPAPRGGRGR